MICAAIEDGRIRREALGRHLAQEIVTICPDVSLHKESLGELTDTVALFCSEQGFGDKVPTDFLNILIARALCAVGEDRAAHCLAQSAVLDPGAGPLDDAAVWPGVVTADTWAVFASRLMRPARWFSGDGRVTWVLDFSRLAAGEDVSLELALLPALRMLLERIAEVWDASSGLGALGLRSIPSRYSAAANCRGGTGGFFNLPDYCAAILRRLQAARSWTHTPRVVRLDLAARR